MAEIINFLTLLFAKLHSPTLDVQVIWPPVTLVTRETLKLIINFVTEKKKVFYVYLVASSESILISGVLKHSLIPRGIVNFSLMVQFLSCATSNPTSSLSSDDLKNGSILHGCSLTSCACLSCENYFTENSNSFFWYALVDTITKLGTVTVLIINTA